MAIATFCGAQVISSRTIFIICLTLTSQTDAGTELGVQGQRFTINGTPKFLYGISYYAGLGAPHENVERDLARMREFGINWIRVWATWEAFDSDVSAVDADGGGREPYLSRLKKLLADCDRLGLIVDVTVSRGTAKYHEKRDHVQTQLAHLRTVETLVNALRQYRNWYLDLGNERNVKDKRYVSFADLKELREAVRKMNPKLLVTASEGGDINDADLRRYVLDVKVDFICPHRDRDAKSPSQTEDKTRQYLAKMRELGRVVPVNYQEPFRRGYTRGWEPKAEDYVNDARGAERGGAGGWCLHNGNQEHIKDGEPRRSFDLRHKTLFEQLDDEEQRVLNLLRSNTTSK